MPLNIPAFANSNTGPANKDFGLYNDPEYQQDFVDSIEATGAEESTEQVAYLQIYGMNCSACAWLIEKQLQQTDSVISARVNYSQRTLYLQWDSEQTNLSDLVEQIYALGFEFSPSTHEQRETERNKEEQLFLRRIGVAGIGMMQVGMYAMAGYFGATDSTLAILQFASMLVATLVIFYAAKPFFVGAWRAITHKHLSMDVPVSLALGLAYIASLAATWSYSNGEALANSEVYFDAICMFSFFLLVSRFFEFKARSRWQNQQLEPHQGNSANLIDEDGSQRQVPSRLLATGNSILVKTGELFPVDVLLQSSRAEISQAQLTGEFQPLDKHRDDKISSGSINLGEPVEALVLRPAGQSTLSRIRHLVNQAQLHKPRISGLADQISGYFVATVLLLAMATYVFWIQKAPEQAFWIALSVLVVSCPCALSLATPTALTVLMQHLHSQGILVQNPSALEKLQDIDQVIFDKTGTLTCGEFQIEWVQDLSGEGEQRQLARARALEQLSNHPVANAFSHYNNQSETSFERLNCSDWKAHQARGIEACLEGELVRIGDKDFVDEIGESNISDEFEDSKRNQKLVYLGNSKGPLAVFALSDLVRSEAAELIESIKRSRRSRQVHIFSGDNSSQVSQIGKHLGIEHIHTGMSAAEKMQAMVGMQNNQQSVLAIGDGINDTPLLASADISIAVSNAVELSKQKADFILVANNILAIDELFSSAARGKQIIAQNLSWALAYNICAIPLAMMGLVAPWLAALGMSASSAVVVLNAFRAKTKPGPYRQEDGFSDPGKLKPVLS